MNSVTRRDALKMAATAGVVLAGASVANAKEGKGDKDSKSVPAVTLRAGEGKVDHKAEKLPEALEDWPSVKLYFGANDIYNGAVVIVSSAWGEGNHGRDLWGWVGGAGDYHSDVRKDSEGYYFIYSLQPGVGSSRTIAAQFRYQLAGGALGVTNTLFPFPE